MKQSLGANRKEWLSGTCSRLVYYQDSTRVMVRLLAFSARWEYDRGKGYSITLAHPSRRGSDAISALEAFAVKFQGSVSQKVS